MTAFIGLILVCFVIVNVAIILDELWYGSKKTQSCYQPKVELKEKIMDNVEFIPNHEKMTCWHCDGTGQHSKTEKCRTCDGTGIFIETYYYLIAKMPNGQKIGFGVDSMK